MSPVPSSRPHVVDALYLAMSTLDPDFVVSLRGVSVSREEWDEAESMLLEQGAPPAG
jgi:hypothetical protein